MREGAHEGGRSGLAGFREGVASTGVRAGEGLKEQRQELRIQNQEGEI
jgi:hypothetical protein